MVFYPDQYALRSSNLNPFLFADVGLEPNGSQLTMLSALARLDHDPWVEAGRWAELPKADAVECLIATIAGVSLSRRTASETRAVASSLVMLLPEQDRLPDLKSISLPIKPSMRAFRASLGVTKLPRWLPMIIFTCATLFGIALGLAHSPNRGNLFSRQDTEQGVEGRHQVTLNQTPQPLDGLHGFLATPHH